MTNHPPDRAHIHTEQRNPRSMGLDALAIPEIVALINEEDRAVADALAKAAPALSAFISDVETRMRSHGRLIYVGAGTSGRLGVLDAAECPPTFQTPPDLVIALIAGGDSALRRSSESREDDPQGALSELESLNLSPNDSVLGIAAGGTTPYVLGALAHARERSSLAALLTCTALPEPPPLDHLITLHTGPEVLTGSTRMKAGTATKLALNTITTTLMVRLGKCYENLMVDLRASNDKLRDRAARIISTLTGLPRAEAFALLDRAQGHVKPAILMHHKNLSFHEALVRLEDYHANLRAALEAP